MLRRVGYAYAGYVGLSLLLAILSEAGGPVPHSLLYFSLGAGPFGMVLALAWFDRKRNYSVAMIVVRSFLAFVLAVIFLLSVMVLDEKIYSKFLRSDGWLLMPALTPLIAAMLSGLIGKPKPEPKYPWGDDEL